MLDKCILEAMHLSTVARGSVVLTRDPSSRAITIITCSGTSSMCVHASLKDGS